MNKANRKIVVYLTIIGLFLLSMLVTAPQSRAVELCRSTEDAARQTVALEGYELCKAEVAEWQQYSIHKETEITAKDQIIDTLKEQVANDEKTIQELKMLSLKVEPKFRLLLSPVLYTEIRTLGTLSADLIRGGVKMNILKAWGLTFYGKAEGSYRDDTKSTGFGVYAGAEWRLW